MQWTISSRISRQNRSCTFINIMAEYLLPSLYVNVNCKPEVLCSLEFCLQNRVLSKFMHNLVYKSLCLSRISESIVWWTSHSRLHLLKNRSLWVQVTYVYSCVVTEVIVSIIPVDASWLGSGIILIKTRLLNGHMCDIFSLIKVCIFTKLSMPICPDMLLAFKFQLITIADN